MKSIDYTKTSLHCFQKLKERLNKKKDNAVREAARIAIYTTAMNDEL